MNWFAAVMTGVGMGIAYFGGLWFTVRRLFPRQDRGAHQPEAPRRALPGASGWYGTSFLAVSRSVRLTLVGFGFYTLSREGADLALAGLAGLWLARGWFLWHLKGASCG
jgi:hypothetical protein